MNEQKKESAAQWWEDIKQAFVDGFYDGAEDDAWYEEHVQKSLKDYLYDLKRFESERESKP